MTSAQKDGSPVVPTVPLILGQPVDGMLDPTSGPQFFSFSGSQADILVLDVESEVGAAHLDVIVRDALTQEVVGESTPRFDGVRFQVPEGVDTYQLELYGADMSTVTPYHVCLGSEGGASACPSLTTQQTQTTGGGTLDFTLPPNYGTVSLNGGFLPDPHAVQMTSGGSVNVAYLGNNCTGWATSAPDYSVSYSNPGAFLRFSFVGSGDTTLIINKPDGSYACDDDSGGGFNPQIDFTAPASGRYDIWVGSYSEGMNTSGTLNVTERTTTSQTPPQTAQLDFTLPPNFGFTTLSAGFTPDPFTRQITSGGTVDVSYLGGGCTGWATSAPDFSVNYTSGAFPTLRFEFVGNGDTTLIINGPGADYVCDDDSGGNLNPRIDFSPPANGRYDVWVGSYGQGQPITGTLQVTEIIGSSQTPPQPPAQTGTLDYTLSPNFGSTSLVSGFTPDPFTQVMTSGGTVDVSYLGSSCTGWATSAPDFSVDYTSGGFSTLRFYFAGNGDTTMIINGPNGDYTCADDSYGTLHPTIDFSPPASGRYDIWIGSYSQGSTVIGTLSVTETGNHP